MPHPLESQSGVCCLLCETQRPCRGASEQGIPWEPFLQGQSICQMAQLRPRQIRPIHWSASSLLSHHLLQLHERTRQAQLQALQGGRQQVLPVKCLSGLTQARHGRLCMRGQHRLAASVTVQDVQTYCVWGQCPCRKLLNTLQRLDRQFGWVQVHPPH